MLLVSAPFSAPTHSGHIATLPQTLPFRTASEALFHLPLACSPASLSACGWPTCTLHSSRENHPASTAHTWMPCFVRLHPLFLLPRIPSLSYLPGKGLFLFPNTAQRAWPLRRPSRPLLPLPKEQLVAPHNTLYTHLFLQQIFTGRLLCWENKGEQDLVPTLGCLQDGVGGFGNFVTFLMRYKTPYGTYFPLCITAPYTRLLGTFFFGLHQPCLPID